MSSERSRTALQCAGKVKLRIRQAAWAVSLVLTFVGILSIIVFYAIIVRQEVVCVDGCELPFPYVLYAGLVMTLVGCVARNPNPTMNTRSL
jgi:hypothetical protein